MGQITGARATPEESGGAEQDNLQIEEAIKQQKDTDLEEPCEVSLPENVKKYPRGDTKIQSIS